MTRVEMVEALRKANIVIHDCNLSNVAPAENDESWKYYLSDSELQKALSGTQNKGKKEKEMSICIGKKVWFVPSLFADPVPVIVTEIENVNPNLKNRLYLTTKTSDGKVISGYVQQFSTSKPTPYNANTETGLSSVYFDYSQRKPVTLEDLKENFMFNCNKYIDSWKSAEEMIEHLKSIGVLVPYTEYLMIGGK